MHYKEVKGILSSNNTMNLYRGCTHNCIYCDSRSTCYNMKHDFEDVEVKGNALILLEERLKNKRRKCMIHMGSMSDSYIPLEKELKLTRGALKLIYKYGHGISLITKSDLVLRDLDLLKKINEKTKCVVQMTLTTYDDELCSKLERNICPTSERLKCLEMLNTEGIPTVVWLTPLLPFINDNRANIEGIISRCNQANVYEIMCFGIMLTLRQGSREYYYEKLDKLFPGYKEKYIKRYGNRYVLNSPNNAELMNLFHSECEKYGIVHNNKKIFEYLDKFEEKNTSYQMRFFD